MGCRVFQPRVSPAFALSRALPARPTPWARPQRRARDRGRLGGDVPKENTSDLKAPKTVHTAEQQQPRDD